MEKRIGKARVISSWCRHFSEIRPGRRKPGLSFRSGSVGMQGEWTKGEDVTYVFICTPPPSDSFLFYVGDLRLWLTQELSYTTVDSSACSKCRRAAPQSPHASMPTSIGDPLRAFPCFLCKNPCVTAQWAASLISIIAGSVLLCTFSKCAYTTAAALYVVAAINDIVVMSQW